MSKKINVAIIAGGFSNEREISLMTAQQVAKNLPTEKYNIKIIEIALDRSWLLRTGLADIDSEANENESVIVNNNLDRLNIGENIDVAFLALHGKFGEDGRIQAMLEYWQIPYTGSGVLASALGMNKLKCIEILNSYNIKTARHLVVSELPEDFSKLDRIINDSFGYPIVIKPNESGSSVGVSIIRNFSDLEVAVSKAFQEDGLILIEEYLVGRELTCPVMGNSGSSDLIALPPAEILAGKAEFFDYQAKYFSNDTKEVCPAEIGSELTLEIQELAKKAHIILGCDGLTRSDFILRDGVLYFLEINTIPGQTEVSLSPKAAKAIGWSFSEFLDKQIEMALLKWKK